MTYEMRRQWPYGKNGESKNYGTKGGAVVDNCMQGEDLMDAF